MTQNKWSLQFLFHYHNSLTVPPPKVMARASFKYSLSARQMYSSLLCRETLDRFRFQLTLSRGSLNTLLFFFTGPSFLLASAELMLTAVLNPSVLTVRLDCLSLGLTITTSFIINDSLLRECWLEPSKSPQSSAITVGHQRYYDRFDVWRRGFGDVYGGFTGGSQLGQCGRWLTQGCYHK